ncbi:hypothetical protein NDK47_17180 [Brevibacillus ruminantium]|uniref:DUF4179 domain-containing protein n=1 Tax=Brevibacillus ruminantium TaxID=2950604 RepID=A0ABY4WAK8_9BACL|nr:hypothetical protein [Brevibacillus ruminantium]USG63886.1 hypothetical protein NDK47_17180 [Brevibacillus ruminantium]
MDRDQWLKELKERADRAVLHDVAFSPSMEEKVRRAAERERQGKRAYFVRRVWAFRSAASVAAVVFLLILLGSAVIRLPENHHAREPLQERPWLPGTVVNPPDLWKPSPPTVEQKDDGVFSYLGEKPVRVITDEHGYYEDQTQTMTVLLNGSFAKEVQLVAYSTKSKKVELGTYQVMGTLYDADGHFRAGVALPDPGVWKIQVLSEGKHFGQVFIEVKEGISPVNRDFLTPLVTSYLQSAQGDLAGLGTDREVKLALVGVEAPNPEKRRVYAWVSIIGKAGEASPGLSCPIVLDIFYTQSLGKGDYRVVGHRIPEDGSLYQSSLREMFPEKYLKRLDEIKRP